MRIKLKIKYFFRNYETEAVFWLKSGDSFGFWPRYITKNNDLAQVKNFYFICG